MSEEEEIEEAKNGTRAESGERMVAVSGEDPTGVPGVWRRSKVNGYCWFEPALFDQENESKSEMDG